jgi:flavin-dependent dehydrogenase
MLDVLVIGGGPAGSTAATLLARQGFSVTLIERERFPRFQIGESLLPYNNDLFDRLGVTDQLQTGDFFPKYGAEFLTGDGKVGYTFRFDRNLSAPYDRSFQVKRSEFDALLLKNAEQHGVTVQQETSVTAVDLSEPNRALVKTLTRDGNAGIQEARFVIDASGHGCVIGSRVGEKEDVAGLTKIAIFAHYRNVQRSEGRNAGNTVIVVIRNAWFWLIPVSADTMSVGLVVDRDHLKACGLSPEQLLEQTIAATPLVAARMAAAERVTQVYARKDFSYAMKKLAGSNFALIGDAAGFLDPIFSTGVFMAMKSADIVADAAGERLRTGSMRELRRYETSMTGALAKYFRFISNFYRREFLEVFMQPGPNFGLIRVIVGILAGDVFQSGGNRLRMELFFALVRIQKIRPWIAKRIGWESLPSAASAG